MNDTESKVQEAIFETIHQSSGKSKNGGENIRIETSTRGFLYRSNVYLNDFLIDAKEVSCVDIALLENAQVLFKERYLSTHYTFEKQYFMEKVFTKVLSDKGRYIDGDGKCVVNTYIFENIVKNEVLVDDVEIDSVETELEGSIVNDKKIFKIKYTKLHKECIVENISIEKFPVNTFLNNTLKKFPRYEQNPMHAFYFFVATVVLVLWIISFIVCGRAMPKLAKKVGGREASLVVRDIQRSICIRGGSKKSQDKETKQLLHDKLYKQGYLAIPEKVEFKNNSEIKTLYIKNTLDGDLIVKINNKIIDNLDNALVTANMIIKVLSPQNIIVKPDGIGEYEFKIEKTFLTNGSLEEGVYTGRIILEVTKVKYNTVETMPISFSFRVSNDKFSLENNKNKNKNEEE